MAGSIMLSYGYVKRSITRDFALLAGGMTDGTQRRNAQLQAHQRAQDPEGRAMTGGLEIVSDATE